MFELSHTVRGKNVKTYRKPWKRIWASKISSSSPPCSYSARYIRAHQIEPPTPNEPGTQTLSLMYGCYGDGIFSCKMDSLVRVKICITANETLPQENQRELLCSLYNVTNLELVEDFGVEVYLLCNHPMVFLCVPYSWKMHIWTLVLHIILLLLLGVLWDLPFAFGTWIYIFVSSRGKIQIVFQQVDIYKTCLETNCYLITCC